MRRSFVSTSRPRWALLAAVGAAFVAGSIAYSVSAPIYSFVDFGDRVTPLWSAMAVGAFAGAALARAAGGPLGVVAFAAYLAAGATITVGGELLYERAIQGSYFYFIAVSATQLALWQLPSAIAVVAGSLAGARLTRAENGTNAFLEAAGAYSLVPVLLVAITGPGDPRLLPYFTVFAPAEVHVPIVAAQAIVAGAVLALRSRGPLRPFALAGFALVGLVNVMPGDFTELVSAIRFHWTEYWPRSLILVPLCTALLVVGVAALGSRTRARLVRG